MRAPPFPTAVGTELRLDGHLQVVDQVSPGKVVLRCPLRHTLFNTTLPELAMMRMDGRLQAVGDISPSHKPSGTPRLESLTKQQREVITRRIAYTRVAAREYPVGPKSPRLNRVIEETAERLGDRLPPSPHSVYRWLTRYVLSGYDSAVFMQDMNATRTRSPRVADEAKARLREHIQALLGSCAGATLHGITDLALAKTAKDLGYFKFVNRDGVELLVDEYIPLAEAWLRERAKQASRAGAKRKRAKRKAGAERQHSMEVL